MRDVATFVLGYLVLVIACLACYRYCVHTTEVLSSTRASLHWSGMLVTKVNMVATVVYLVLSGGVLLVMMATADSGANRVRAAALTTVALLVPCGFLAWTCHTYLTKLSIQLS